jgi:hypothetical protein
MRKPEILVWLDFVTDPAAFVVAAVAVALEEVPSEGNYTSRVCSFCLLSQSVAPSRVVTAADTLDIEVAAVIGSHKTAGALAGTGNFGRKGSFAVDCWLERLDSSRDSSVAVVPAGESAVERYPGGKAKMKGTVDVATGLEDFGTCSAELPVAEHKDCLEC